jgi:hypothetical protein
VADVPVELDEGSGVEQLLDALAREQLSLCPLPLDGTLASLVECLVTQRVEPLELALGGISGRRQFGSLQP